jgi:hypothetical protein
MTSSSSSAACVYGAVNSGTAPPFDVGPDTLFVAYSAWAEMTCFQVLGWQFPVHIFDQHTAYLAASNVLLPYEPDKEKREARKRTLGGKGLHAACERYGIHGWEGIPKDKIARDIGEGRWRDYGMPAVFTYCQEDVRNETRLLRAQLRPLLDHRGYEILPAADVARVLWWSNYSAKAVALIQARGMPIDVPLWNLVQENQTDVIAELLLQFDPSHGDANPIYAAGGTWNARRFEQWLLRSDIPCWPRHESGRLDLTRESFRMMEPQYPSVAGVSALRDSLSFLQKATLPIGRDRRNRPSLMPFNTATSRNAHSKSLFNTHAGLRSFMVAPPGKILAYLDWRTQEVGVAAALSRDPALLNAYNGGDIYHALARVCGLTADSDPAHWKKHNPVQRQRMKALQLGINYGMGIASLARGLERHPLIASGIITQHQRTYRRFHQWRGERVDAAMVERQIRSTFGWPLRISSSPNQRTLFNFPMQSGGAEMLRLAAVRLCDAGLVPSMLIHDGILLELDNLEQVEHAKEIMRLAGRDTCKGLGIGVDVDQMLTGGSRYTDKRPDALKMWKAMMRTLETVGARVA